MISKISNNILNYIFLFRNINIKRPILGEHTPFIIV